MDINTTVAIVGANFGIGAGIIGTYIGFRYHSHPKETIFNALMASILLLAVLAQLTATLLLTSPWKHLSWTAYFLFLPFFIAFWNKRSSEPSLS
ncbi:hypothetical protein [Rubellicoccus peritrichatus]|uniref:Uncharacterized protein n=1 Tax=Rubellicoccus peritrichatus TaxID=3080537 RepID=A0AAQ3QT28_9BACT|nr:hypothetical protein [Puniceicoccus sp. CR14]WOO43238.1 hypothetical protein RZN69_09065 [Puniceicoccus sp. CR14]